MRRAAASAACLVLLGGLAAGCSSAEVDPSEIDEWMSSQERSLENGGMMSGRVGPGDEPGPGTGVTMTYEAPTSVGGVRLSCFREDTLMFVVEVTREDGAATRSTGTEHEVSCAEGDYTAEVDGTEADAIRVDAYGAERDGAWHAVILEE